MIRGFYFLWIAVVSLSVACSFSIVRMVDNQRVVHGILCQSQADDQRNLRSAIKFLHEHPNGSADFSKVFILNAIKQDRQKGSEPLRLVL